METLITSIMGIHAAQKELEKYSTEKERKEAMEIIQSKAITSSCYNILYFIVAAISAVLIHWVVSQP